MITVETCTKDPAVLRRQIRFLILCVIIGLVLSGVTAFPIYSELAIAHEWIQAYEIDNGFGRWIKKVFAGVAQTHEKFPFIAYGTDWLAFAHLVIAFAFVGPLRDPVRNIWVVEFGLVACAAIFPLAFIAGPLRGIPFFWQLIDCSFGLAGGVLLFISRRKIKALSDQDRKITET